MKQECFPVTNKRQENWNQVLEEVQGQVGGHVWFRVGDEPWSQVYNQVGRLAENQMWVQITRQIWNQIEESQK